ncbi:MAG: GntR family transcriptional regulator [Synergistaceae bacterium]|jgi:DNA-binding GntR family transcriptional regulator|nr:GntR family transcriptional regulator [Synergistaceae bacterium]
MTRDISPKKIGGIYRSDPLRRQVYDYLRDMLISGNLRAGEFVNQSELMSTLGVSRTPLRDSLMQLEAEGFVSIIPCRGVMINPLTLEDIRCIYQIGGALEAAVCESVFPFVGPGELRSMTGIIEETERLMNDGDYSSCHENNSAFHEIILGLCDNAELLKILRITRERLYNFPGSEIQSLSPDRDDLARWESEYWRQHRHIVGIFKNGTAIEMFDYIRRVHWAFDEMEKSIQSFYHLSAADAVTLKNN